MHRLAVLDLATRCLGLDVDRMVGGFIPLDANRAGVVSPIEGRAHVNASYASEIDASR